MNTILSNFGELGITIGKKEITAIERATAYYFMRGEHPLTFDGMKLGVHPVAFKTSDYNLLFDTMGLHKQDLEKVIRRTPSIDRTFMVQSEPYNLLSMWLVHLAPIFIKDPITLRDFQANILRLYLARIFTSAVNNSWRHGAREDVSEYTIMQLSRKSDIVRLESWKRVIESHVDKILDPNDRFYPIIVSASPDDAFLQVIAETQTALRAKIVTFAKAYYEAHASGKAVDSRSSISQNAEGEKIIAQSASVIDSATQSMITEILNPNTFVHDISVHDVAGIFTTISARMLKTALLRINETAVLQTSSRTFDKVEISKTKEKTYIGVRALVQEIIRTMVRICRERRVNMGNRVLVFSEMKNALSSSRNSDPDILAIKRSISTLVDPFNITSNEAAKAALKLAVAYYIVFRTIQKMK